MKSRFYFKRIALMMCVMLAVLLLPDISAVDTGDGLLMAAGAAFAPLEWPTGQNNMGGFKPKLLFVPFDAVSAYPTVPAPGEAADNDGLVTAAGSFVFKEGATVKKPIYLYSTDGQVGYTAETQGETDGISYRQTLTWRFPGNLKEMHAFNALVKNTPGFFIFEDSDGRQMIMGAEGLPVATAPSYNGGQSRADARGTTYTATADSNYTGIFLGTPIDFATGLAVSGS